MAVGDSQFGPKRFAAGLNGVAWTPFEPDVVPSILRLLTKEANHSVLFWRIPDGVEWAEADPRSNALEYLQVGGNEPRLAVEWRRRTPAGFEQLVVGPAGAPVPVGEPTAIVQRGAGASTVHVDEVHDIAAAVPVVEEFLALDGRLGTYRLRPVDVILRR